MVRRKGALIFGIWIVGLIVMASLEEKTMMLKFAFILIFFILFLILYAMNENGRLKDYMFSNKFLLLLFVVFLSACINFELALKYNGEMQAYMGKEIKLKGLVTEIVKDEENNHQFIVKTKREKVLVKNFSQGDNFGNLVGRNIEVSGLLEKADGARNPRGFDYNRYLKSKEIYSILNSKTNDIKMFKGKENKFLIFCQNIRENFKKNIYGYFDEKIAGMIIGMSFGEKMGIDPELYDKFQKNGICHILAVSGLHIGAIYSCLNVLGNKNKNIFVYIIIVIVLFVYVGLSNFASSTIRAFIMIVLHMMSKIFKKKYDMLTAGFFTMFIMTLKNPMLVENIGFQLSFCAILTLAVILPSLSRISKSLILGSLAMQIGMAPYSAYVFNYFSISALFLNIPVIFLSGILIPLIMFMLLISQLAILQDSTVFDLSFKIIGIVCEFLSKLILFLNNVSFFHIKPFVQVISPPLTALYLYYVILFFISTEFFRILWQRQNFKKLIIIGLCLSLTAFSLGKFLDNDFDKAELIFCDVGQGDCLLVRKDGKNILLDTGGSIRFDVGEKILTPFLLKNGVNHLDMVIISHFDKDHVGGLASLNKNIKIDKVAIYEANCVIPSTIEEKTGVSRKKYFYMAAGDSYVFSKKMKIEILFPFRENLQTYKATRPSVKDENLLSLVAKVSVDGVSVLMTGDLDFSTEAMLVSKNRAENLKCDILKVSHHGSRYGSSEALLNVVKPKIAVVQVGKNNYGHPSEEALYRISKTGAVIFRNDKNGAVGIDIKKNKIEIMTMLK